MFRATKISKRGNRRTILTTEGFNSDDDEDDGKNKTSEYVQSNGDEAADETAKKERETGSTSGTKNNVTFKKRNKKFGAAPSTSRKRSSTNRTYKIQSNDEQSSSDDENTTRVDAEKFVTPKHVEETTQDMNTTHGGKNLECADDMGEKETTINNVDERNNNMLDDLPLRKETKHDERAENKEKGNQAKDEGEGRMNITTETGRKNNKNGSERNKSNHKIDGADDDSNDEAFDNANEESIDNEDEGNIKRRRPSKVYKQNKKEKKRDKKEKKKRRRKKDREEESQDVKKSTSRKRSRLGMGFGAASISFHNEDDKDSDSDIHKNVGRMGPALSLAGGEEREDLNENDEDKTPRHNSGTQYQQGDTIPTLHANEERTSLYSKEALAKLKEEQRTFKKSESFVLPDETARSCADGDKAKGKIAENSTMDASILDKKKSVHEQLDDILDRKEREAKKHREGFQDTKSKHEDSQQTEFERGDDFVSFMNENSSSYFFDRSKKKGSSLLEQIVAGDEALTLSEKHDRKRRNKYNNNGASSFIAGLRDPQEDIDVYAASADDGMLLDTGGDEVSDVVLENDDWGQQAAARGNWLTKGEIERRKVSAAHPSQGGPLLGADLKTSGVDNSFDLAYVTPQIPSLAQLKQSMKDKLEKLTTKKTTNQKNLDRKQSECSMLQKTIDDENQKIQSTLNAQYHFYQKLRLDLTPWIDTLRRMDNKVNQVQSILESIAKTRHGQYQKWYDNAQQDTVDELHAQGLLEGMIGATCSPSDSSDAIIGATRVDEFGRDIGNATELARSERWDKRRSAFLTLWGSVKEEVIINDKNMHPSNSQIDTDTHPTVSSDNHDTLVKIARLIGQSPSIDLSFTEKRVLQARLYLLRRACQIVQDELKDDHLDLKTLVEMFDHWYTLHPHEYDQCRALQTLIKFVDVVFRLEVLENMWIPLAMSELKDRQEIEDISTIRKSEEGPVVAQALDNFLWYQTILTQSLSKDATNGQDAAAKRHADKILPLLGTQSCLPMFTNMIKRIYDPLSTESSKMVGNLLLLMRKLHIRPSEFETFQKELFSILRAYVSSIGFPLVDNAKLNYELLNGNGNALDSAIELSFAIITSQIVRLEKVATNICIFLFPYVRQNYDSYFYYALRSLLFSEILKDRLLPAMSSLSSNAKTTMIGKSFFTSLSNIQSAMEQCNGLQKDSDCRLLLAPISKALAQFQ